MADNHLNDCKACSMSKVDKKSAKKASKRYREKNKEKISHYNRKHREENKQYHKDRMKEWHRINKHLSAAYKAKRKACKLYATPCWSDLSTIKDIYLEARRVTDETGVQHHVDHIVPLVSKLVCGLHIPINLRVIPYYENCSKGNRLIEDIVYS